MKGSVAFGCIFVYQSDTKNTRLLPLRVGALGRFPGHPSSIPPIHGGPETSLLFPGKTLIKSGHQYDLSNLLPNIIEHFADGGDLFAGGDFYIIVVDLPRIRPVRVHDVRIDSEWNSGFSDIYS